MSADDLIFTIGTSGSFEYTDAYRARVPSGLRLTVRSVRSLSEMIKAGDDPSGLYEGLDPAILLNDTLHDRNVLQLQSDAGEWFEVPQSQILTYPRMDGLLYRPFAVVAELGIHQETMDFSALKSLINSTILQALGVKTSTVVVSLGASSYIDNETHARVVISRENLASALEVDAARVIRLSQEVSDLKAAKAALEKEIIRLKGVIG